MIGIKKKHKGCLICILLALFVAACAFVLPWKSWVENRLEATLRLQGLKNVHLTLSEIGIDMLYLSNISFGDPPPLTLNNLKLHYTLRDLLDGHVQELAISGLDLNVHQSRGKWSFAGLDGLQKDSQSEAPFLLPATKEELSFLPFGQLGFDNIMLRIRSDAWQLESPLQLTFEKEPTPKLEGRSTGIRFCFGAIKAETKDFTAKGELNETGKKWIGTWQMDNVQLTGLGSALPVLNGKGGLVVLPDQVMIDGAFSSEDKATKVAFHLIYSIETPTKSGLILTQAIMPLMKGSVSVEQVNIPLQGQKPIELKVKLKDISVSALLQELTGKEISATGTLSGLVPVSISPDGGIMLRQGKLQAAVPGVISLSPEIIPGDNEQVAFVREVLKNFHYTNLSVGIDNDNKDKLSILMTLDGLNPDVLSGKRVKMNVNLRGDMLNLIKQNMLWLSGPHKMLEQSEDDKK